MPVRRWILSRLAAGVGLTAMRATVFWQVYDVTKSAGVLGLVGLITFLPAPFASLAGGMLADAFDRRRVIQVAQLCELAAAAALVALSSAAHPSVALLIALYVVNGVAVAVEAPSRQAMLPRLVPSEELGRAVTVMSTAQSLAFVSGPALAGLLLSTVGARGSYVTGFVLLAISAALVASVRPTEPGTQTRSAIGLAGLREGLRYVLGQRALLGALSVDLFAVIFGGASAMLPVYANDVLAVGARGYGILAASLDAGAVLTSLALMTMPPIRRLGRSILLGVVVYGLATIAFAFSRTFALSIAVYALVGIADQVSVVGRSTLVQLSTPDALRGRVSSINMIFIMASNQLSVAESGFVAAMTSPTFSVASGGVGVLVVAAIVALAAPELWRYRSHSS
ncbi:MAG: MFS transporter [Polyangiaceae bacterium]